MHHVLYQFEETLVQQAKPKRQSQKQQNQRNGQGIDCICLQYGRDCHSQIDFLSHIRCCSKTSIQSMLPSRQGCLHTSCLVVIDYCHPTSLPTGSHLVLHLKIKHLTKQLFLTTITIWVFLFILMSNWIKLTPPSSLNQFYSYKPDYLIHSDNIAVI